MSPTAVADLKGALGLSVYFETTKRLLTEAIDERNEPLLRRCNLKMQDERFNDLPADRQRELRGLFARAIRLIRGWGAE